MPKKLLLILFLFISVTSYSQSSKEKYHRAKIYYKTDKKFKQLEKLGLPLDHGKHKKGFFIESDFSESHLNAAKDIGVDYEIIINDVQQHYMNQNNPNHKSYTPNSTKNATCTGSSPTTYTTPINYNNGSMGGYLTYAEMLQELDDMKTLYPNLISTRANVSTFTTTEGRVLQYVKISDNPSTDESSVEPQILYTAIHHAREAASLQQLVFYMWFLLENYSTDNEIKAILDNTELYFVPCVNPDGYVYNETTNPSGGGMWRKNRRDNGGSYGVDNNRNYSYITSGGSEVWNTSGTSGPTGDTYAGASVFSEPENQAIRWLVEQNNFVVALNAHSSGDLLLYPYGYAPSAPTPDNSTYQTISSLMASENNFTNQISADLYPAAGDSDDFMYGMLDTAAAGTRNKIYAMTPEIGPSFWPAASQIEGICKDMIHLNMTAAQITNNYATIEDTSSLFTANTSTTADYKIQRIGLQSPGDFTVSINPISTNILSVGASNLHNGLSLEEIQTGNITLNLNPSISTGDDIVYELIVNNGLFDKKLIISKKFANAVTILNEPADNNTTNWNTNSWGTSTSQFYSASSSITDSPSGNYNNNQNKTIELSNSLDLTTATNAVLSFYAKWDIENNFDYVQIQISIDNGSNWIPQCGKHTNIGVSNQTGANNEPVYDGVQSNWVLEEINLTDYLGNNILMRFQLVSDGGSTKDGFYFDDLKVNVVDTTLATENYINNNFEIYPNPVQELLHIKTNLTNYHYKLYTLHGQLITDKRNNNNLSIIDYSNLSSGMYFIDIEQEGNRKTYKIIKN